MWLSLRSILPVVIALVGYLSAGRSSTMAQSAGSGGSLGGYGAVSGPAMSSMGGALIPYAGSYGGFMPYRMGGGSALSFGARSPASMGSPRTSFSLTPLSRGMSSMADRPRRGFGAGGGFVAPLGSRAGTGLTGGEMGLGGMRASSPGSGGMGILPPRIGYPFQQPPSLVSAPSATSMSMP
jgi:hypothetical protein